MKARTYFSELDTAPHRPVRDRGGWSPFDEAPDLQPMTISNPANADALFELHTVGDNVRSEAIRDILRNYPSTVE